MKIHKFECNICGLRAGLENVWWGVTEDLSELVNPRDAEIHLCWTCFEGIAQLGVKMKMNLGENDDKEV